MDIPQDNYKNDKDKDKDNGTDTEELKNRIHQHQLKEEVHEYIISFKVFGTEEGVSRIANGLGGNKKRIEKINNTVVIEKSLSSKEE